MSENKSPHKQGRQREKMGGGKDPFDLEIEPIPVYIRRSKSERVVDAIILIAIAVAAQVVAKLLI